MRRRGRTRRACAACACWLLMILYVNRGLVGRDLTRGTHSELRDSELGLGRGEQARAKCDPDPLHTVEKGSSTTTLRERRGDAACVPEPRGACLAWRVSGPADLAAGLCLVDSYASLAHCVGAHLAEKTAASATGPDLHVLCAQALPRSPALSLCSR